MIITGTQAKAADRYAIDVLKIPSLALMEGASRFVADAVLSSDRKDDTVILCGVCLLYGFAGNIFPAAVALAVVCINFLLDAVISTTSLATNIYVREIASNQDELTSTLSTGISINHLIAILAAPFGGWI